MRRVLVGTAALTAVALAVTMVGLERDQPAGSARAAVAGRGADRSAGGIEALRQHLGVQPRDHVSWAALALGYVERARTSGDPTLYAKADEALVRSLRLRPDGNSAALAARAALEAARHDFGAALADADAALRIDGYDQVALAARTDALTELGRYDEALAAARAADAARPTAAGFARLSYQFELRGDTATALALLDRASAELAPDEAQAFVHIQVAELHRRRGDLGASDAALDAAAARAPDQPAALAARARLLVALGRPAAAVPVWARLVARAPLPEHVTEYGELLEALGRDGEARAQYAVVTAVADLAAANGVTVDLETAHFHADHGDPAAALAAAQAEWRRRQSVHVADALGWALHRSGRSAEAVAYARQAVALGGQDARFLAHLGQVEAALGRTGDARVHLSAALRADPGLSPWQRQRVEAALDGRR